MAILADKDGFLIGKPTTIESGRFTRVAKVWSEIRADTRAIRKALVDGQVSLGEAVKVANQRSPGARSTASAEKPQKVIVVGSQAGRQSPVKKAAAPATPNRSQSPVVGAEKVAKRVTTSPAALPRRDSRGRFIRRDANGNPINPGQSPDDKKPKIPPKDDDDKKPGFWRTVGGKVAEGAKDGLSKSVDGTENIDPVIAASKEVGSIVAPLLKPLTGLISGIYSWGAERRKQRLAARENAKEQHKLALPWYKRMIGGRVVGSDGGGGRGILGFLILGALKLALLPLMTLGSILTPLARVLTTAMPMLARLAAPVAAMFSSVKSLNTTSEEYAKRLGVELNGSLAQELGVRFVGVMGDLGNTLTAGLAEKFGNYLSDEFGPAVERVFEKVAESWLNTKNKITDTTSSIWDSTKSLFGGGSAGNKQTLIDQMNAQGLDAASQAMMLAQTHHETGGFRNLEESFRYTPSRLREVSSNARYMSDAELKWVIGQGDAAVAELMYKGKNGNTQQGDAYRYRGRGFVQLTGRANYAEASKAIGVDLVANPDLAADPVFAAKIATWWYQSRGLKSASQRGDVSAATKLINGGTNGLADRAALHRQYAKELGATFQSEPLSATLPLTRFASMSSIAPMMRQPAIAGVSPAVDKFVPGEAPKVLMPIGSNSGNTANVQVTVATPVTQNVGDRQIAQFATGGIGSSGQ